jgi:hypothetical protein
MRVWLSLGAVLVLVLGATACGNGSASGDTGQGPHRNFVMIFDLPCAEVAAQVRAKLKGDPALGLAGEKKTKRGWAFTLPMHQDPPRRWGATVLVQCPGPTSSHLEVRVKTERLGAKGWVPAGEDPARENAILDKITPRP